MAFEHEPVIILGAVIRWIASTLYQVCAHLSSQNAGKGIFSWGSMTPDPPLVLMGGAMPLLKPHFFELTGLESLVTIIYYPKYGRIISQQGQ